MEMCFYSVQSRTQAEEDDVVAVDRDGFMESFFRRVGIKFTVAWCEHVGLGTNSRD